MQDEIALALRPSAPLDFWNSGPLAQRGFMTRAMSGVDARWGNANGLTAPLAFSHNLSRVFPPELFKAHPEYFPLVDGKRLEPPARGAAFWNPDIARPDAAVHAAEAARRYFETHPAEVSFSLGVNDALIWGESTELLSLTGANERLADGGGQRTEGGERTTDDGRQTANGPVSPNSGRPEVPKSPAPASGPAKFRNSGIPNWFRERPNYSNLVFTFMNRAAEELSQTHPNKYLGALAYYWAESASDFPIHPQVVPFLTADRAQGYDRDFRDQEFEVQRRWAKVAGVPGGQNSRGPEGQGSRGPGPQRRLGLYDYLYGGGYLIPRIWTRLLAENLRHARRAGFTDYYAEVNPNWGLDGPMPWLAAQLLQDPEQSETALLDEYYRRYFREAAVPMRRFFERCEELWMSQPGAAYWLKHYRNESQAGIFPSSECRALREILDDAARRLAGGRNSRSPEIRRASLSSEGLAKEESPEVRKSGESATGGEIAPAPGNSGIPEFRNPGILKLRVKLVSDAFGVTERFVQFQEARDRLTRMALRPLPSADDLTAALENYLDARRDFIRYTLNLERAQPLAVRAFDWSDYLKNDPVPLALLSILSANSARSVPVGPALDAVPLSDRLRGVPASGSPTPLVDPIVQALWKAISESSPLDRSAFPNNQQPITNNRRLPRELLRDPGMTGSLIPARTIAGLPYGVSLPTEWQSRVEPAEHHRAELTGPNDARILRISGTKDTTVSQWCRLETEDVRSETALLHRAAISVRGRVSPGTAVSLVFSWLGRDEKHVGFATVRLPAGEWPEWVGLEQAGLPPAGAAWVGLGLRVQNQVGGDWVEAKGFSIVVR